MLATITTTDATAEASSGYGADIELYGTWDGAVINLEIKTINGDWQTLASYTEDTINEKVETKKPRQLRFKAASVGASTSVKVAISE